MGCEADILRGSKGVQVYIHARSQYGHKVPAEGGVRPLAEYG